MYKSYVEIMIKGIFVCNIYLVSGIRLSGRITEFDDECLILTSGESSQIVLKQAIATIMPNER